jgi:hypothetical protein
MSTPHIKFCKIFGMKLKEKIGIVFSPKEKQPAQLLVAATHQGNTSFHYQLFQEQEKISLLNRGPHEYVGCKQNILPHLIVPFYLNSLKSRQIDSVLLSTPKYCTLGNDS